MRSLLNWLYNHVWIRHSDPEFDAGESLIREGRIPLNSGLFAGRFGSLKVTNRRIICNEGGRLWPFKPTYWEVELSDIAEIDGGGAFDRFTEFRGFRVRLRTGKYRVVMLDGYDRDAWIDAIREVFPSAATTDESVGGEVPSTKEVL